ncbi:MAG: GTP-binding protein [Candidatus Freyarchaeota archaeon]|nr:GTP-binding protein [Candidatus Jordarchaeia archaeon]MBS7270085.1 GTP-binding protein [Candidatus Jordarchaeia archaeon]MBS7280761.1 GTP-binding protein [Candidatus Jordarchaeia archaeon]
MVYGLYIFDTFGNNVFERFYGKINLHPEALLSFSKEVAKFVQNIDQSRRIGCFNLEKFTFIYSLSQDITLVLCSDQKEDEMYLINKLVKVQEEAQKIWKQKTTAPKTGEKIETEELEETEETIREEGTMEPVETVEAETVEEGEDSSVEVSPFSNFEQVVDEILFPFLKIAILGSGGVGKSSVLKLVVGDEPDANYIPTVGVDIKEFDFEVKSMKLVFWDFSGQPHFRKLWQPFLEEADLVIVVSNSTVENLVETKSILQLIKAEKSEACVVLIANKQDLPEALPPDAIEKYMGMPAHGLVAIDPNQREKLLEILKAAILELIEKRSQKTSLAEINT